MKNNIITTIELNYSSFSKNDKIIAKAIINDPKLITDNDIESLAKILFISRASITRFCLKIDIPGFKELKYAIAQEQLDSYPLRSFSTIIDFFEENYHTIISRMKKTINEIDIKYVANQISQCQTCYVLGIGNSGFLAQEISLRIKRLGINSVAISDADFIKMQTKITSTNDFVIFISLTGKTQIICEALATINEQQIEHVLLTEFASSKAAKLANKVILTPKKSNLGLADSISNNFGLSIITDIIFHYIFLIHPEKYQQNYASTIINS
ncbi:MAG: MurR/RpiR family transcriptional regulator [Mycoplasmatales bacterium]